MGRIVLVRHGKTALNAGGESAERIRGWRDVPLSTEGIHEAERLGREFKGKPVKEIYCSPLIRARETARNIALTTEAPMHINIALLPWHLGFMTGEPVKSVIKTMNERVQHEDEPVKGGEPFSSYRKRFLGFLKRKVDEACPLPNDEFLILVTHSRGLQITRSWIANGSPDDLTIDVPTMLNYEAEVGTGGQLWMRCSP